MRIRISPGQSGLGALIIPGWAQEGGRDGDAEALRRSRRMRARIIKEPEQAMTARFGGPQGVYLPRTQQELTAVMKEMNAGAGETVLRILEQGDPGAILRFGIEDDLIKILQDPVTSMACDCGASTATRMHPRFYGSYPARARPLRARAEDHDVGAGDPEVERGCRRRRSA